MKLELRFHLCVAIAIMGFTTIAALELATFGVEAPYLILLPAAMVTVAIGGGLSAALAVLIAAIVTWFYFLPPYGSFELASGRYGITLLLYVGVVALICRILFVQRRNFTEVAEENMALRLKMRKLTRGASL
jgi:K+-sensing histidine kinase KdpD